MSESKHTPGPWEADGNGIHRRLSPHYAACIAVASDPKNSGMAGTMEANARLIAAAPDLLEALEEVLNTGLNGANNMRLALMAASQQVLGDEDLQAAEASETAVEKARAAIAKARGE